MFWGKERIYLDYASSTQPLAEAIRAMRDHEDLIGNPGAIHTEAVEAKNALEKARDILARELACKSREIVFTSGLTEANNLAILGLARKLQMRGVFEHSHWVVSAIEHSAVLEAFAEIERMGGTVTHIHPDERGIFTPEKVMHAIRPTTVLLSIGWANNETGTLQPLRDISRAVKEKHPSLLVHSDAGQAPLYRSAQVHTLGVDLLSLGSNKLYGPHGIGALYVSSHASLAPILLGGGQERSLRSGTENVALAAGFAAAVQIIARERDAESERLETLRKEFAAELTAIPGLMFNTDLKRSLPHVLNVSIPNIQSEYVTLRLDAEGIAMSTKSACAEGGARASHVVKELPGDSWRSENTLRFSLGRDTTRNQLLKTARILEGIVQNSA